MTPDVPVTDLDILHAVMAREGVRSNTEILKATGIPPIFIANELMVNAIKIAMPVIADDDARQFVSTFFTDFFADMQKKLAAAEVGKKLCGGVLPFGRAARPEPINDNTNQSNQGE